MKLSDICKYRSEKIELKNINKKGYVSTDNMLPNFAGVGELKSFPNAEKVNKYYKNDILLSNIRPYFKKMILSENESGCSSDVLVIEVVSKEVNPKFLYYRLRNDDFFDYVVLTSKGTKMPRGDKQAIMNFELNLPILDIQNKIVKILEDIDSKIKLNNIANSNLLQLCKYKYDELDKKSDDWNLVKINDLNLEVTDYVANGSFKSLADNVTLYDEKEYALYVRNTDLKVNFTDKRKYVDQKSYEFLKKSKLNGGELIISNVGDVGSVFICPHFEFPMTLGSNVIMLYSVDQHYYNYFLYFFFTSPYGQYKIKGITGGSAQPKFNKTDFRNMEINIPPLDVLDNFNKYIEPIYKRYELNIKENERLSELRDTLLPKLMNGEINLDNIEI